MKVMQQKSTETVITIALGQEDLRIAVVEYIHSRRPSLKDKVFAKHVEFESGKYSDYFEAQIRVTETNHGELEELKGK